MASRRPFFAIFYRSMLTVPVALALPAMFAPYLLDINWPAWIAMGVIAWQTITIGFVEYALHCASHPQTMKGR